MSTPDRFVAINTNTNAVEAIGTRSELFAELSKNMTLAEVTNDLHFYVLGQQVKLSLVFTSPVIPAI